MKIKYKCPCGATLKVKLSSDDSTFDKEMANKKINAWYMHHTGNSCNPPMTRDFFDRYFKNA